MVVDAVLQPSDISADLLAAVARLEPYGEGHDPPLFALTDDVVSARAVGQGGKHLQLRLPSIKGVAWSRGVLAPRFQRGRVDAAVSLRENSFSGKTAIEFVAEALRPAAPFSYDEIEDDKGEDDEGEVRIKRLTTGTRPDVARYPGLHVYGRHGGAFPLWQPAEPPPPALLLRELPLHDDPLRACEPLEKLVTGGGTLLFALDAAALEAVRLRLADYPSLAELRATFSRLRAGRALELHETKALLCRRALSELGLLDVSGRVLRGDKRDPYRSPTFLGGLIVRYRLQHVLTALMQADDASFARAVRTVLAPLDPASADQDGPHGA